MARINVKPAVHTIYTAEGARAVKITPVEQLRRLVMASLLWEDSFYVDGKTTAQYVGEVLPLVKPEEIAAIAIEARTKQKLRHVPLLLVREMARLKNLPQGLLQNTLVQVIERVDELNEFLAIYWKDGKQPLSGQVKKGLAAAFNKFDRYQFAKYDGDAAIKVRDVAFLVHPKPVDPDRARIFAQLFNKDRYPVATKSGYRVEDKLGPFEKLAAPDTWENSLSNLGDATVTKTAEQKKEEWTRLLTENRLGALALLRNLRNMTEAGVDEMLIRAAIVKLNPERVLPFRFISAARYAPQFEGELEQAMMKCLEGVPKLPGKTTLVVDNSGSMYMAKVSAKSELLRADAACALAILLREICDAVEVVVFSDIALTVRPRRGFALRDQIKDATPHRGTDTAKGKNLADMNKYDRIILLTDEQSHTSITPPKGLGYCINVANEKSGIGYGAWHHIDGWSEAVVTYIAATEQADRLVAV